MRQIEENRTQSLAITIRSILEANLKTASKKKKRETLGEIAENMAVTLAITIRCILEVNLKTTSKKQRNFATNSKK